MNIKRAILVATPWFVISGLLYAGLFIKPAAVGRTFETPPIERRDVFYDVATLDLDIVWAVGAAGKIVRSDDSGRTWRAQASNVNTNLQSIATWDRNRAVAVGNGGSIVITADGGATWSISKVPLSAVSNKFIRVTTGDVPGSAWIVGEMGAVFRTKDFGRTWTRLTNEEDSAWNDIAINGGRALVVGEFGKIMVTENDGATWKRVSSSVKTSLMSVTFSNEHTGVAVGLDGVVLTTRDGGATWTLIPPVTSEHLFDVTSDGQEYWVVGDKGVLLHGDKTLLNWVPQRISSTNLLWNTRVKKVAKKLYFAGSKLTVLSEGNLKVF